VRTVAEALAGSAAVVQVNTQDNPRLAAEFGVRGIPSVHLLVKGRSVAQTQGAQAAEALIAWFRRQAG
jgi:thioredoxin 2